MKENPPKDCPDEEPHPYGESAIRQLLETQTAILAALPANIALLDSQGIIISVNEAWKQFVRDNAVDSNADFGVGQNYLSFCQAQRNWSIKPDQITEGINSILTGTSSRFLLEYSSLLPSQQRRFELLATPMNAGQSAGVVIIHTDITERRQSEAALKRMEGLYRLAISGAGAVPYASDFKNRSYLFIGEGVEQLIGYAPHEVNGELWRKITQESVMLGEAIGLTMQEASMRIVTGELHFWRCDMRVLTRSGESCWISDVSVRNLDDAGRFIGCMGILQDITDRKNVEEALKQSQLMLRIAGRISRLGGWMIHLPERKLIWSDETCVIHDVPPGYVPGFEEGVNLFYPEHRAEVMRLVDACEREGKSYEFVLPKMTAKGRRIWVRSTGEAVRDAEGKIIRLQGAFQDITEHKQADLELSKVNRALRMVSACGNALTRMQDEKDLLTEVCRLAVEIGGYRMAWVGYAQNDEVRTIAPVAHAGYEQGYLTTIKLSWSETEMFGQGPAGQAIRGGQVVVFEDITHHTAFFNWLEEAQLRGYRGVICLPLRDASRTFGLLTLYSSETTKPGTDELELLQKLADDLASGINNLSARAEHRKAQQAVAQQAALLDKARDAIIVRDLNHRIKFWNKGAERVYGWKAAEAIGAAAPELLSPQLSTFWSAVRTLFEKGEWGGELQEKNKDGHVITMDCRWTLVSNERQEPDSVLCIETDVTEKKKLEAQFLRAQRMESIGTLAGGIAHDLNNVLAPILMSVALLKPKMPDLESEQVLRTVQQSAQRGAELVKQVLSFARGVEGQRVDINLLHLLREIQVVVRDTFPKSIVCELVASRELWTVVGDPTQLHQVFINLCLNARDAMPTGGTLTITLDNAVLDETCTAMNPDARPGTYVLAKVLDTGVGIAPEILDRIFEPFFTTKEVGKGTGLGLSTTLTIVKSHGGFINVYSEPGEGTNFQVYLPSITTTATEIPDATVVRAELPRGKSELVLVVDDEEAVRNITRTTLERFGYRVIVASNGAEAIALYAQHQKEIALVLTDMAMPIMDGHALIVALKTMNPKIRIVASSGFASNDSTEKIVAAGVQHFLSKPYTAERLLAVVKSIL